MVGPLPPPAGGVAAFVDNIVRQEEITTRFDLTLFRTGGAGGRYASIYQPLIDIGRLVRFVSSDLRKAEIIHIHTSSYWSFWRIVPYTLWAKGHDHTKLIVHVHGGLFEEFFDGSSEMARRVIQSTLASADRVVTTSTKWVPIIERICGEDTPVRAVPNGFDPSIFHPMDKVEARKGLGIPLENKVLLTVGYLEKVKGHSYLIEALKELADEDADLVLYIVGEGRLRKRLERQARELGLSERVLFVGNLPPTGVAAWMSASDLFVLPSLGEGNPTVMFECMGCGRPVVATRVGGIPDVLIDERLGAICEPGDSRELASSIRHGLRKDWDSEYISDHARQYLWNEIASQLKSMYEELLQER